MRPFELQSWSLAICAALLLCACSDDTSGDGGGGSGGSGGGAAPEADASSSMPEVDAGVDAAVGVDSGSPATPTLNADVAGQACTTDDDCPVGGTCATELDLAGTLAAFTGVAAEPTPAPGGTCTLECTSDAECGTGGTCVGDTSTVTGTSPGMCQHACAADADCRDGYRCVSGGGSSSDDEDAGVEPETPGCVPIPATASLGDGVVGTPCAADADCGAGATCQLESEGTRFVPGTVFPGGSCSGPCLEDAHCGAGGRCVLPDGEQGAGTCVLDCAADGDCRDGYRCRDQGDGLGACVPGDPVVAPGEVGIACTLAADGTSPECGSRCLEDLAGAIGSFTGAERPAPGGYCSAHCLSDADCGEGLCLGSLAQMGYANVPGLCYKPCTDAADCGRDGYECRQYRVSSIFGGSGTPPTVCQPIME